MILRLESLCFSFELFDVVVRRWKAVVFMRRTRFHVVDAQRLYIMLHPWFKVRVSTLGE